MKYLVLIVTIVIGLFFSGCSSKKTDRIKKQLTKNCKFNSQNSRFDNHDIVWTGGCLNGYLSGEGVLAFYTKDTIRDGKYYGYMRNGMMNDTYGKLYPPTPDEGNVIYMGGFKNNLKDGYGEYWKPMSQNRVGLLFKIKSKDGKMIDKNYVGRKPARKKFSEKSLAQEAMESSIILATGLALLVGSIPSSSSTQEEFAKIQKEQARYDSTPDDAYILVEDNREDYSWKHVKIKCLQVQKVFKIEYNPDSAKAYSRPTTVFGDGEILPTSYFTLDETAKAACKRGH